MYKRIAVIALVLLCCGGSPSAQPTEEATHWEAGEAARKKQDWAAAVAAYRRVVELNPSRDEAHSQFVMASYRVGKPEDSAAVRKELFPLYESWAAKHPRNAQLQLQLGYLCSTEKSKAEPYFQKAVALNPKLAKAWMELSLIAEIRGENKQRLTHLKKAADATPEDPSYLFYYSHALRESDPKEYRRLTQTLLQRFPQHERSAQALYWLAFETRDLKEKRQVLEQLRRDFPPAKFSWSKSAMDELFNLYAQTEPAQALALAEELAKLDPKDKSWASKLTMQQSVMQARALIAARKFSDAATLLETAMAPRYTNANALHLTKAEAYDSGGDTAKAFASLLNIVATEPKDELLQALQRYGTKLSQSAAQTTAELWRVRDEQAKPFKEFALAKYTGTGNATVNDYRGKVVLVNFWYPTCGPCRGEFPNLQKALAKYGAQGFVILAINLEPPEDDMVLPYLKNNRYDFIPLKANWEWAKENYGVRGAPTNFLLDREGRVVFKPGVIRSEDAHRTFELQIEALLARKATGQ